jgi:hypothetical protein
LLGSAAGLSPMDARMKDQMNVDAAAVSRVAALLGDASQRIVLTGAMLHGGNCQAAEAINDTAGAQVREALRVLYTEGGALSRERPTPQPADTLPSALRRTTASCRLLEALEAAAELAEIVDAERGNVVGKDFPLLPGEPRGTGWAETLSALTQKLRDEVEGTARPNVEK